MADPGVLERIRQGGRARERAFGEIVERWQAPLFRVCFRLTSHREDAEDAAQETLAQAYVGLPALRDEAQLSTWLFRIAVRTATRVRQARAAKAEAAARHAAATRATDAHDTTPDRVLSEREQAQKLLAALDRLPWEQRVVLSLSAIEELDRAEIASVVGIPVGTVDSRLHHARRKLAALLELPA